MLSEHSRAILRIHPKPTELFREFTKFSLNILALLYEDTRTDLRIISLPVRGSILDFTQTLTSKVDSRTERVKYVVASELKDPI